MSKRKAPESGKPNSNIADILNGEFVVDLYCAAVGAESTDHYSNTMSNFYHFKYTAKYVLDGVFVPSYINDPVTIVIVYVPV